MTDPTVCPPYPAARRAKRIAAGVVFSLISVVPIVTSSSVDAARTIHVSTTGNDASTGSSSAPVRTIGRAVALAQSGDTVSVRTGVYNESVQVYRKAVHIQSAPGHWAALDGSIPVGNFRSGGSGAWYADGWTRQFYRNPGPMVDPAVPTAAYPDQVFYDGQPMRQVLSRSALAPRTFYHETGADRIWIGSDPAGRRIEASNRSWGVYFNEADGSSLTNMSVRRYATQHTELGAIRAYADDVTISGVISEFNAYMGISVIGRGVQISNTRVNDNGYIGIHGNELNGLTINGSAIVGNNTEGFSGDHSAAGIKVTSSSGLVVADSEISDNAGPGVWSDIYSSGVTVVGNLIQRNGRSGVELELTNGATVAGNAVSDNGEAGIWILETQNVNVWHNTVFDNEREISVLEGPRSDVSSISIRNNILGRTTDNHLPMLEVNDWTENRSAVQMGVTSDHNTFWRASPSTAPALSQWGRWPVQHAINADLSAQVASVSHGSNSVELPGGPLPVRSEAAADYRGLSSATLGAALSASVANTLGLAAGSRLASGSVEATPTRRNSVPTTRVSSGATSSAISPDGYRTAVRRVDLSD